MRSPALLAALSSIALMSSFSLQAEEESPDHAAAVLLASNAALSREPGPAVKKTDACAAMAIAPNSNTPAWDAQAATTQCGAVEIDSLFTRQPVGGGARQSMTSSVAKYGLTPRFEIRWDVPGRIAQDGGGTPRRAGTTDQWFGSLFRFHDQGPRTPDLAIDYALKFPTANPAKGFGTGYTDHQFTLIASRDFGRNHVDMNAVALVAGSPRGRDGAAQFGTAVSRSFTPRVMGTLEVFGGSQPATTQRYGAVLAGAAFAVHPWLAINGGIQRAFTGGAPRSEYMLGFIYTVKPKFGPPRVSRLLRAPER